MKPKIGSIILAAGRGTRLNSKIINKVVYPFLGKPMILYGVDLLQNIADISVVVIGAYAESVKNVLKGRKKITLAYQTKRLGTGHAAKVGLKTLKKYSPTLVLIGYGDHMMFYKETTIRKLIDLHMKEQAAVTFITTYYHKPQGWGRIERDKTGEIVDIIEEKDSTSKQKEIKEVNAGFYCFDFTFLAKNLNHIKKSKVSGEYYLTDIVLQAFKKGEKVIGMPIRFREVGIGVNRHEELTGSQALFKKLRLP